MTKKLGLCRLFVALLVLAAIVVFPAGTALAYPQANPSRVLPGIVQRGETFNVTVNFTAPANNFFLVSLSDLAPAGWDVTAREAWCTPTAASVKATGNKTEIIWGGSFNNGTFFTAVYMVAVPEDAAEGFYTFTGYLKYYIGDDGPYLENTTGDSQVLFPPELEGQVDLKRKNPAGNSTWETPLVVRFFDNATHNETAWSPINVTTDAWGNFTIDGIPSGTYDVGVKNWTSLSRMVLGQVFSVGNTTTINFTTTGVLTESDTDNNDRIILNDFNRVLTKYGAVPGDPGWNAMYDFDRSGAIDLADFNLVLTNYGQAGDIYKYLK
jgi:hypothetical protein